MDEQKLKLRNELPVVTLRDTVVFPGSMIPLTVGRSKVKTALDISRTKDNLAIFVSQKNPRLEIPQPSDLYQVGTVATIKRLWKVDGDYNLMVEGLYRVYLKEITQLEPYLLAKIEEIPELAERTEETEALIRHIFTKIRRYTEVGGVLTLESSISIFSTDDPNQLVNSITASIDIKASDKQQVLEIVDTNKRLARLSDILNREIRILEISQKIDSETQERVGKAAKEAILREKMRSIEKELGEEEDGKEIYELKKKIKASGMPADTREKAEKELASLAKMSAYNPEAAYKRSYLEVLVDLPWAKKSFDQKDIAKAEKILNEDHYGLPKVKERILEYLAVHNLVGKIRGPILCFAGPPGVGKTSVGKSIARALGRKFIRVSLGGIHDEAEIRGHRRTYVGALPGRIIQGVKNAGTRNPIFMLDEIDKIGVDFRGDPSSALLEALDPEQNNAFSDHYLEVSFDLSDVMFVTTANILDTIPPALRDRLEVITFPGYTAEEKFHISKDFLMPKQLEAHGLADKNIKFKDSAIWEIINRYTREAGVRDMEREMASVCRKVARSIAQKKVKGLVINTSDIHKYLGPAKYTHLIAEEKDEVGMATGLSVTQAGGEILFIEVSILPGKGNVMLTGQLGDVMKESAHAAMSYVRSRAERFGLDPRFHQKIDVHIHVPEGAVPKEGPSAGIAITTALVSALTKIASKKEVGMTGEVTLRGRVLEIGGIKEKIIAAHRAGLKTIIMPKDNKKDLEEIPTKVKKDLQFIFATHMDEVLDNSLVQGPFESSSGKKQKLIIPSTRQPAVS